MPCRFEAINKRRPVVAHSGTKIQKSAKSLVKQFMKLTDHTHAYTTKVLYILIVMLIFWSLSEKFCQITTYFWRVLANWNHCVAASTRGWLRLPTTTVAPKMEKKKNHQGEAGGGWRRGEALGQYPFIVTREIRCEASCCCCCILV